MSEQPQPAVTGIEHGPYPQDGTHYSQSTGHFEAIKRAHEAGRIDDQQMIDAETNVGQLVVDEYNSEVEAEADKDLHTFGEEDTFEVEEPEQEWPMTEEELRKEAEWQDRYGEAPDEDPLAGDVDRWVHPDETRSDAQIAHDERYATEPYADK